MFVKVASTHEHQTTINAVKQHETISKFYVRQKVFEHEKFINMSFLNVFDLKNIDKQVDPEKASQKSEGISPLGTAL